jgi:hypothetical protein
MQMAQGVWCMYTSCVVSLLKAKFDVVRWRGLMLLLDLKQNLWPPSIPITTSTLQPFEVAQVQINIVEIGVGAMVALDFCSFKTKL